MATDALLGDTATVIAAGPAIMVILAEVDLVLSAMEVAVSLTIAGLGTFFGAV